MKQTEKEKDSNAMMVELKEDTLMYRRMEAEELQRELSRLQAKIDALELEAMEVIYK